MRYMRRYVDLHGSKSTELIQSTLKESMARRLSWVYIRQISLQSSPMLQGAPKVSGFHSGAYVMFLTETKTKMTEF